jgi:hypothetical protein
VGEGKGGEEGGGVASWEPAAGSTWQAFMFGGYFTNDRMVSEMSLRAKVYAVRFRIATRRSLSLFDFSHSMSSFRS